MRRLFSVFFIVMLILGTTSLLAKVKVGEEVSERFETPHPYPAKKGVVYEKTFHYPNAGYIALHFSEFDLAKNDVLEISSPDGRYYYEYKEKGKKIKNRKTRTEETLSEFWATHIPGDTVTVILRSKNKKSGHGFVIDKWARGYEEGYIQALMEEDELAYIEAICSSDDKEWAKCYEGTAMYTKARAVCRLLIGGTSACTGWLLGSEGHIMTNNHCISTQSSASNTDYEFMAEGATCSTSCASWGACPGTVEASSGTLIQTDSALDFTLILLPTNITSTYGYMQLRDTLPSLDERIYIPQHPSAYGKQIAVESDTDGPYAKIYSTNESPCSGGPGDIGYYADTEGGSSGSPVLAYDDNLVVALHHCADCPNRGVPIPSIISDLGANIPNDAIGSVGPPQPPVANFSANPTTVEVGNSVQFTDLSTNTPTSWSWTFAGGTPSSSTAQNPTVTYNTIGTYTVTLTATNVAGSDTETKTNYITVQEQVIEYCTSSGNNQSYEYIAGVDVSDLSNSSGASGYSDFTYMTANLEEGESAAVLLTPGFVSSSYTEYWAIWIDYNVDGDFEDSGEQVFTGSGSSTVSGSFTPPTGTAGVITRMRVSMQYSSSPSPCGTFTYGEVEDYTVEITGSTVQPPVAEFTASATSIYVGDSVTFTDQSSSNPTSWSWTFNGGTPGSSTAQNPTITYNTAGTYTVSLTATNSAGSDTETKTNYITVSEIPVNPPVAEFSGNPTTINTGGSVSFTDQSTNNPTSWSWTFAGGTPSSSTAQNPTITYNTAGTYNVSLTVSNSAGSDTETKTDYITVSEVLPTVGITDVLGSTSTSANRRAMPFTMPENGTITSITMYHTGGSGDMILGVYDGASTPQNRLAVTAETAVSGSTGWQTIDLTTPCFVAGGSTVWLAWVYESNPGIRYGTGSPGRYQSSDTWSGGMPDPFGSGSQTSYVYSIYATYSPSAPPQHTLTTTTVGQGSITLDPTGGTYDYGTVVTLTAEPASGWQFDGWSGDLQGSTNPTTITMNSNKSVTATFSEIGTTATVGYTTVFGSTSTSNYRRAMPFTMPEDGTITSISMYHTGGSGSMILAVYNGTSTPQNRIAITPTTAVSGSTGWQTINLTTPVSVTGGSTVWLAWVYESNPGIRYQTGSPGRYQSSQTWSGGMPDPFGSGSQTNYIYSIYATYNID